MSRPSRDIWLYFACQALVASTTSLLVVDSALVGAAIAPDPRLATLPVALQQVATLVTTYPASQLMARVGRRVGFSLGALLGMAGSSLATVAILRGSFALFCAGSMLIGGYVGFATFYRFAAAESASPEGRGRAVGWIMSAGVLAAFIGPWLARRTVDVWPAEFAASYALLCAMAFVALVSLQFLARPAPIEVRARSGSARAILRKPSFLVAAAAAAIAGFTMIFVMTATPLAMEACGHGFDRTTRVIQWHVVAMFAPSFVTGRLVSRFGAGQMALVGLSLCAASALVNASGDSAAVFQAGLLLLGLGWNFAFIGATTMIAAAAPEERAAVQGLNDLVTFSAVAIASLLAGVVQESAGWRAVNIAVLPPLALAAIAIAARLRIDRRATNVSAGG